MRKVSVLFVAALLLSVVTISANDLETGPSSKSLSSQISSILQNNVLTEDDVDLSAQVRFTLNNKQEIVVLSVDSDDETLENFVIAKLNYQKVDVDSFVEGKLYTVSVRVAR